MLNLPHKGSQKYAEKLGWPNQLSLSAINSHLQANNILTKPPNLPITHLLTIRSDNKGTTTF